MIDDLDAGDLIRHNAHVTPDRARAILQGTDWYAQGSDGGVYAKTNGMCLEHPVVADLAQSLDQLGIAWSSSKDKENCVTFLLPPSERGKLAALGCALQANPALPSSRHGEGHAR
jgi:hypothetical protein